ncbi:GpE family phage tail protein [Candidatus Symbiopectobacterium sp.]|nr:GpE family phage tail protein [Candidatus Symbiopectobacterium sp.]
MTVDDLTADIAAVFHCAPDDTAPMSLSDLLAWRHKALIRSGAVDE